MSVLVSSRQHRAFYAVSVQRGTQSTDRYQKVSHPSTDLLMSMKIIKMAFLLSSPRTSSAFAKSYRRLCQRTGVSPVLTTSTSYEDDQPSENLAAPSSMQRLPYFPIYYNDVYEVDLPKGHRFPMEKYRRVRLALQDRILSSNPGYHVICGK
jgi:hypothetical protein